MSSRYSVETEDPEPGNKLKKRESATGETIETIICKKKSHDEIKNNWNGTVLNLPYVYCAQWKTENKHVLYLAELVQRGQEIYNTNTDKEQHLKYKKNVQLIQKVSDY